jgi:hypothetical protein
MEDALSRSSASGSEVSNATEEASTERIPKLKAKHQACQHPYPVVRYLIRLGIAIKREEDVRLSCRQSSRCSLERSLEYVNMHIPPQGRVIEQETRFQGLMLSYGSRLMRYC